MDLNHRQRGEDCGSIFTKADGLQYTKFRDKLRSNPLDLSVRLLKVRC